MRFIYPFTNSRREGAKIKQFRKFLEITFSDKKSIKMTFIKKSVILNLNINKIIL